MSAPTKKQKKENTSTTAQPKYKLSLKKNTTDLKKKTKGKQGIDELEESSNSSESEQESEYNSSSEDSLDDLKDEFDINADDINGSDLKASKKKKKQHPTSIDFTNTLQNLLNQTIDEKKSQPILSKSKGTETELAEAKLEFKARRALALERKRLLELGHVLPNEQTLDYERRLRKVATQGVVKLFNAIKHQQKIHLPEHLKNEEKLEAAKLSKASFLELLKQGAKKL